MLRVSSLSVFACLGTGTKFQSKQTSKPWHLSVCICYHSSVETQLTQSECSSILVTGAPSCDQQNDKGPPLRETDAY